MADRPPTRLGPAWVWLIGLLVVGIGILLLIDWVGRDHAIAIGEAPTTTEPVPEGDAESETDERRDAIAEVEHSSTPVPLATIVPLGPAHSGAQVTFQGLAITVLDEGLWIDTPTGETFFARVIDANGSIIAEGSGLTGRGVVRHDPIRVGGWITDADLVETERTGMVTGYYIETTVNRMRGR